MRFLFLLPFYCLLLLIPFAAVEGVTYPVTDLDIKTQTQTLHFTVEVATTRVQQEHGLMFRKSLAPLHGMIFIFPTPRQIDFWMKNTLIPLDMIFIDEHGTIKGITANATPLSEALIPSPPGITTVLEVAGGTCKTNHIAQGDQVIYSLKP